MKLSLILIACAVTPLLSAQIVNGDFESFTLTPLPPPSTLSFPTSDNWNYVYGGQTPGVSGYTLGSNGTSSGLPTGSSGQVGLASTYAGGWSVLCQAFATSVGQTYTVNFDLAWRGNYRGAAGGALMGEYGVYVADGGTLTGAESGVTGTNLVTLFSDTESVPLLGPAGGTVTQDYGSMSFSFTATDTSTDLSFYNDGNVGTNTLLIDNVSVSVPEPTAVVLVGTLFAFGLMRRRRRS